MCRKRLRFCLRRVTNCHIRVAVSERDQGAPAPCEVHTEPNSGVLFITRQKGVEQSRVADACRGNKHQLDAIRARAAGEKADRSG